MGTRYEPIRPGNVNSACPASYTAKQLTHLTLPLELTNWFQCRGHAGAEIDDLLQEALIRLNRQMQRNGIGLTSSSVIRADHLLQTLSQVRIDFWRRDCKWQTRVSLESVENSRKIAEATAATHLDTSFDQIIADLDSLDQKLLKMRFEEDRELADIADRLSVARSTVCRRCAAALKQLAKFRHVVALRD